jgi:predicted ATPase/tRNA A-37 threonylcarbamoyl transferase component Bud32
MSSMSSEAESRKVIAGKYRLIREIGSGGMATVYLADDLKHQRQVAIKVMKPELASAIGHDRFLREIEIVARLNHPHVLPLFDSGADGERLFYVMPFISGASLRARLDREKQLDLPETVRLTREIASALGHAHRQGLVHRDIKPENVLLADGIALVADFGVARAMHAADATDRTQVSTELGVMIGTPRYMSPEQVVGGTVDGRTDLYALACVVFEMLAGRPPFVASARDQLVRLHLTATPPALSDLLAGIPSGVSATVAQALAKDASDRQATVTDFAAALNTEVGRSPTPTPTPFRGKPNRLPRPRSRFVGRQQELADCAALLLESRLVTLTGIGGSGKTRLAIKLAQRLSARFSDGVYFADLSPIQNPDRVARAVAVAIDLRIDDQADARDSLARHLYGQDALVVLDNCEHLLASSADLVDFLLSSTDQVRILATSREALGVEGEHVFAVRSLAVPAVDEGGDLASVRSSEAVALFLDRAGLVVPGFSLTTTNAAPIAEICRRLDGIPLAIELAAARAKVLSVEQIRSKLDDRFRLLTGGSRSAVPRHQTLLAAIQWSYDQLSDEEQQLLRQLSVFAGGWTLPVVKQVVAGDTDEFELIDLLTRLVDKSLVFVDRGRPAEARYGMLESVRQYALERLTALNEANEVRQRHASEYYALAQQAYPERFDRPEHWADILEREHDNLRVALISYRDSDVVRYLELLNLLGWFWQRRSHLIDGREQLAAALDAARETLIRRLAEQERQREVPDSDSSNG